ncbi:hypothetical protein [Flavobacterium endophyticum]|uniref:hypothetical protein n=1 Tax=Flavobacterium endophyticum TaxID=1540163 RepID=UPI001472A4C5|nr:hypothetical protein [Flavobacterium endophyticum]
MTATSKMTCCASAIVKKSIAAAPEDEKDFPMVCWFQFSGFSSKLVTGVLPMLEYSLDSKSNRMAPPVGSSIFCKMSAVQ